jgi:hypothetical protein
MKVKLRLSPLYWSLLFENHITAARAGAKNRHAQGQQGCAENKASKIKAFRISTYKMWWGWGRPNALPMGQIRLDHS